MDLMSAQFAKCQTPPRTRNIRYIALNSIPTNKCPRTPSNATGIQERWWDNVSAVCHRNSNNIFRTCYKLHLFWLASVSFVHIPFQFCPVIRIVLYIPVLFHRFTVFIARCFSMITTIYSYWELPCSGHSFSGNSMTVASHHQIVSLSFATLTAHMTYVTVLSSSNPFTPCGA
jgi:hypothetical protein